MDIESLKRRIDAKKIEIDKIQKKIQKLESKKTKEGFLKENDWIYGGAKSFEEAKKFAIENIIDFQLRNLMRIILNILMGRLKELIEI